MLANQGQAADGVKFINPASAADTAAATSGWIDVRKYEGDLVFSQHVGAITGSITGSFEDATDSSGTAAATIIPNEGGLTAVSSANNLQKRTINAGATRGFIRYVGTIATGPALLSVSMLSHPKYTV